MMVANDTAAEKPGWIASLKTYGRPEVRPMLFLGFAAGLPIHLTGSTFAFWLAESGVDAKTLGFLAWVGFAYAFKFLWAPIVDRVPLPGLRRLGQRRSWMLLAQLGVAGGIVGLAFGDPADALDWITLSAVLIAFASATQDIALDAYRIESAPVELQGSAVGAYQAGYRIALLLASAGALYLAEYLSWRDAYLLMALAMAVGLVTVLLVREPLAQRRNRSSDIGALRFALANLRRSPRLRRWLRSLRGLRSNSGRALRRVLLTVVIYVGVPFLDFFRRYAWMAALILAVISLHRISDFVIGNMASKLYADLGFSKPDIANITKIYGLVMSVAGFALAGVAVVRLGLLPALLIGAVVGPASNLAFAWLAGNGAPDLWLLTFTISVDNLAGGFAGTTLIAYMSSLTSTHYTATQYALFSSFYALPGRFLAGWSGVIVVDHGFVAFFLYTAAIGIPTVLLVLLLMAVTRQGRVPAPATPP